MFKLRYCRYLLSVLLILALNQCVNPIGPYKAYFGESKPASQLAVLKGALFSRIDWINRYVDSIRFFSIDGKPVANSQKYSEIQLTPGWHEVVVYYNWDMGARGGLAPALVYHASSRESISRLLRINVEAGKSYEVKADRFFEGDEKDLTKLAHVNYWVEDSDGKIIMTKEEGRYIP